MMSANERKIFEKNWIEDLALAKEFDGQRRVCAWVGIAMLVYAGACKCCSYFLFKNAERIEKELDK